LTRGVLRQLLLDQLGKVPVAASILEVSRSALVEVEGNQFGTEVELKRGGCELGLANRDPLITVLLSSP
jgi:hypothetical protein